MLMTERKTLSDPPLPLAEFSGSLHVLSSNLQFHSNFKSKFCKQTAELSQTVHAVSDLVLHCLPMSHKIDARLIWVNFRIS